MKLLLNSKLQPPILKYSFNQPIEQYRGLCALLVFATHAMAHGDLLIDGFKWPEFVHYLGAGYLSVVMFFCISGYVIAISNDVAKISIKTYFKKRFVRLFPIYTIALLLCIIVEKHFNFVTFIGNLFFLQNAYPYWHYHVPIFVNFVTWSLNYEVLYYASFIPLFLVKPHVWQLLLIMLLISIILINTNQATLFFAQYLNGYYFWLLGLFFGWQNIKSNSQNHTAIPLLSMLFLQLCQQHLGIGVIVLHVFGIHSNTNFNWLFDIPFCVMVMSILTNTSNAYLKFNKIICYLIPSIVFSYLIFHHRIFENERWIMCLIFWVLSLLLFSEKKISAFVLQKLTIVGKISYAIYLLHIPIALLIKKTVFISNRPTEIVLKYTLWAVLTFGLSLLLERYYQPAFKKYLG